MNNQVDNELDAIFSNYQYIPSINIFSFINLETGISPVIFPMLKNLFLLNFNPGDKVLVKNSYEPGFIKFY